MDKEFERQGLKNLEDSPDRRLLTGATVIGGSGHDLAAGTKVNVRFDSDGVNIVPATGDQIAISCAEITGIDIEGQGRVESGGGYMGGGFGAGALAGMAVASVLNALTSKTQIETILNLRKPGVQILLFTDIDTPENLKRYLAPVIDRIASSEPTPAAPAPAEPPAPSPSNGPAPAATNVDRLSELAKLGELRDLGVLTEEEFAAEKARILGRY
jgi:hypothetical protein